MYTLLPRFNMNYIQYAENIYLRLGCISSSHPRLNFRPSLCARFATHISICHSFLGSQERRLHPVRMVCQMAMGGVGVCGWWAIVGCGVRVAECRVLRLLSSTQILFSILEQIKHKPTFFLCFTSHSKLPPPPTTPTSLFNSNSTLYSCTNKTQRQRRRMQKRRRTSKK